VEPFVLDEVGRPDHGPGRTPPASSAARLEVSPRAVVLDNGNPQTLEVRYTSPKEARGSSWAVVLLELEPVRKGGQGRQAGDAIVRLALPVFVTVEDTERSDLRIEQIAAEWAAPDRIELDALLDNRGNTILRASGAWVAQDGRYELALEDLKSVVILPGSRRRVHGVLTGDFGGAGSISGHLWVRFGSGVGQVVDAEFAIGSRSGTE
jgi:P pilus assembly chaperone PapD